MKVAEKKQYKYANSPTKHKENRYRLLGKCGKKNADLSGVFVIQKSPPFSQAYSLSPHKVKHMIPKLFAKAKKTAQTETFLRKYSAAIKGKSNEPTSPQSLHNKQVDINNSYIKRFHSLQKLQNTDKINHWGIEKTISILIDGVEQKVQSQDELVTSLTRLILQGVNQEQEYGMEHQDHKGINKPKDNYQLKWLGQNGSNKRNIS